MAEITPQPEAGSWVKADPFTGPWTPRRAHRHIGMIRGARGVG